MNISIDPINDRCNYHTSSVQAKKHIGYCAVLSPVNSMNVIATLTTTNVKISLDVFPEEQKREILEHLSSYTEDILICEYDGDALAIIPSVYPSSTLCVVVLFDKRQLTLPELLRLIQCEDCPKIFRVSSFVSVKPARMTPAIEKKKELAFEFFGEIEYIFTNVNQRSNMENEEEIRQELCRCAFRIAHLVGCPIEEIRVSWDSDKPCTQTDFPLFIAFLLCFLMIAREYSRCRSASLELCALSSAAEVNILFDSEHELELSSAILDWERISSERNMLFGYERRDGAYRITFHPLRRDWSYLGLKQDLQII